MVKIICSLVFFLVPSFLFGDELVVVLLNKSGCSASRELEQAFTDKAVVERAKENKQTIKMFYGNEDWEYVRKHRVRWFPTVIKFEQDYKKQWVEKERIIGSKRLDFLLDFLGKRCIIPKREEKPIEPPKSGGS